MKPLLVLLWVNPAFGQNRLMVKVVENIRTAYDHIELMERLLDKKIKFAIQTRTLLEGEENVHSSQGPHI